MRGTNVDYFPFHPTLANNTPVSPVLQRPMQGHMHNAEGPTSPAALFSDRAAFRTNPLTPHLQHLRRPSMPQIPSGSFPSTPTHVRRTSLEHQRHNQSFSPPSQHMQSMDLYRVRTPHQVAPSQWEPATGSPHNVSSSQPPTGSTASSPRLPAVPTVPSPSSSWYTGPECLGILNAFLASTPISPQSTRDLRRMSVLKDAVEKQDWAYLTMHQYYCLFSINPSAIPQGLLQQPDMDTAMKMMQNILDSNEILSPAVLVFFAGFPYSLQELGTRWPNTFQYHGQLFSLFISQARNCDGLKRICEKRRFPPVVRELAIDLRISSATFQRLLFTAFLRYIWRHAAHSPQQIRFENDAVALFQQNQADFYHREALASQTHPSGQINHAQETVLEHRMWGLRLKQLGEAFESSLRSQTNQGVALTNQHALAPPHQPLPSPTYPQHPPQHPQTGAPLYPPLDQLNQMAPDPNATKRKRGRPPSSTNQPRPSLPPVQRRAPIQQAQPPARQARPPVPLLPPQGWTQPQQRIPNPARFGLHQAHLRSPVLKTRALTSPLYHFLEGYAQPPTRLTDAHQAIQRFAFTLTPAEMQAVPALSPGVPGAPDIRMISDRSKTVRIRCIKWPGVKPLTDHAWAIADTSWIPYSFFTFNGKSLQQRKKVHNGKDLPIDVTGLLREGENVLEVAITAQNNDTSYLKYLLAIETLGIVTHETIKQTCLRNKRMAATNVIRGIKNKLSNNNNEDDEIAVVESNLTINLFDPFSASKMCDIPVRSVACLHYDCFDLETFLQTRRRKGDASIPDQWRCPICNVDARPQHLLIDGFIEDVAKTLAGQGLSETRAIIVQQDGSWKPKPEVRDPNSVSDRGVSNEPPTPRARSPPPPMEIIDLSD